MISINGLLCRVFGHKWKYGEWKPSPVPRDPHEHAMVACERCRQAGLAKRENEEAADVDYRDGDIGIDVARDTDE